MIHFLIILLFVACGGDGKGFDVNGDRANEEDTSPFPPLDDFSTRLSNSLLIAGKLCKGTETTDAEGQTLQCLPGQWLVTVDNVNSCTPEGCTEVEVIPVIAELVSITGDGNSIFYDIEPLPPVSETTEGILDRVQVRFRFNEDPLVLYKDLF